MNIKNWVIQKIVEREGKKMLEKLDGKKTYLIMGVTIALSALDGYNSYCNGGGGCQSFDIPSWAYAVMASLGIYTRSLTKTK